MTQKPKVRTSASQSSYELYHQLHQERNKQAMHDLLHKGDSFTFMFIMCLCIMAVSFAFICTVWIIEFDNSINYPQVKYDYNNEEVEEFTEVVNDVLIDDITTEDGDTVSILGVKTDITDDDSKILVQVKYDGDNATETNILPLNYELIYNDVFVVPISSQTKINNVELNDGDIIQLGYSMNDLTFNYKALGYDDEGVLFQIRDNMYNIIMERNIPLSHNCSLGLWYS